MSFIQNKNDLVPIMPGRFMGYKQISGEIHITDDGVWNHCPGQDNEEEGCAIAAAPNILHADFIKHFGACWAGCRAVTGQLMLVTCRSLQWDRPRLLRHEQLVIDFPCSLLSRAVPFLLFSTARLPPFGLSLALC